jgi:hypothetical protein
VASVAGFGEGLRKTVDYVLRDHKSKPSWVDVAESLVSEMGRSRSGRDVV